MKRTLTVFATLLLVGAGLAAAHEKKATAKKAPHTMFVPGQIEWVDGPASLPPGAKMAVLEGDPSKPGYFAMRLRAPDGYRVMPHWHPNVERITVISGTFHMGLGDKFTEEGAHALTAGTYATMQPKVNHFAWTEGETEIQVTTLGPWKLVYVDPNDDPRKK
jgi:hypothetical protein